MNKKSCDINEENLFGLYDNIGQTGLVKFSSTDAYHFVSASSKEFPQFVYQIDINKIIKTDFVEKIEKRELPPYLKLNSCQITNEFTCYLKQNGFRKISSEAAMQLGNYDMLIKNKFNLEIYKVKDEQSLNEFLYVLDKTLFATKKMPPEIIKNMMNETYFEAYYGVYEGKAVASSMAFEYNGTAGLYMIAVLEEYRGKGFGKEITSYPILNSKLSSTKIILQSTKLGNPLYKSLGFKEYCNFDLYWKVGLM